MVFDNSFSISDITIIFAVIGGLFALYKWLKEKKLKRAEYVNELIDKMRTDPDLQEVFYKIEYDEPWYSLEFHGSEFESKVDKALAYYSYICYLKKKRILSNSDFAFFRYRIERVLGNPDVQEYLGFLSAFAGENRGMPMTFHYLYQYGQEHGFFECDNHKRITKKKKNKSANNDSENSSKQPEEQNGTDCPEPPIKHFSNGQS